MVIVNKTLEGETDILYHIKGRKFELLVKIDERLHFVLL